MAKDIYEDIAKRTGGDIYIGVVGPVRTGKSTLIKQLMEKLVIPNIPEESKRLRAVDELPQSAAGWYCQISKMKTTEIVQMTNFHNLQVVKRS